MANLLVEKSWGFSVATDAYVEQMVKGLEKEFMTMQRSCADCITNLVQTEPAMLNTVREKGALGVRAWRGDNGGYVEGSDPT